MLKKIPIPGDGTWDYIGIDSANRHVFVSHGPQLEILNADSYELVGKIVLYASQRNRRLEDLRLSEFRRFSNLFTRELYRCLQVEPSLARRRERGGTAPAQVRRALQRFRRQIGEPKRQPLRHEDTKKR